MMKPMPVERSDSTAKTAIEAIPTMSATTIAALCPYPICSM
jgi:hypothetical protein